jgi:lipoprotein NlpI
MKALAGIAAACLCAGAAWAATGGSVAATAASQFGKAATPAAEAKVALEQTLAVTPRARWRATLDRILADDPANIVARAVRAPIALEGGDPATALADVDAVREGGAFGPGHEGSLAGLRASALAELHRDGEALSEGERAVALDPSSAFAHLGRGMALSRAQAAASPLEDFQRAVDLDPDNALAHLELGTELMNQNRAAPAAAELRRAIEINASNPLWHRLLGLVLEEQGDHAGALAELDVVLRDLPDDAPTFLLRAQIQYVLGRDDEATADATRVIESDGVTPLLEAYARGVRGRAWRRKGYLHQALFDLDRRIEIAPQLGDGYYFRAQVLEGMNEHARALEDFRRAGPSVMKDFDRRTGQSLFYQHQFPAAAERLDAHLQAHPDDAYGALLRYLARSRADAADEPAARAQLVEFAQTRRVGAWPRSLIDFLSDRIDARALRDLADAAAPDVRAGEQCEAAFYEAEALLQRGRAVDARVRFEEARAHCPRDFIEYTGAAAELAAR